MKKMTRRSLLKTTLGTGIALGLAPHSRVLGANDDIRVGVVGFNAQGRVHIKALNELSGVRVVGLCDADRDVLDRQVKAFHDRDEKVEGYVDVRRLLDNKDIDAITTATPDHWHALVTIWACQAGKDVYVEKPVSHNLFEGRQMVNAARKYDRIVQFGNASHSHATGDLQLETEGAGRIRAVYTSLNRGRESIGKVKGPQPIPKSVDYNLWTGPAPLEPLRRQSFHYDWHWVWPTGTGEIGNNGIYPLDACRLALGLKILPRRVMSMGGRFLFNDDGETPNSQIALFEYDPGLIIVFELRNLPKKDGPDLPGPKVYGEQSSSSIPKWTGPTGDTGGHPQHKGHIYNFLSAMRSRKISDLRADVLEGHLSTAMVHMANISYRLGTLTSTQQIREQIKDHGNVAEETFERFGQHLAANGVDWDKTEMVLGPWLEMDTEQEKFTGSSDLTVWANQLLRREYREPFVVPEQV